MKLPEEASLSGFTEELYCEARDGNEAVHSDVIVCEKYAVRLNWEDSWKTIFGNISKFLKFSKELLVEEQHY